MYRSPAALILGLAAASAGLQAAETQTETVADGLEHPWSLAFLPDGSRLVTERAGRLRLIDADGELHASAVTGLPDDIHVRGQAGLKDVVLDPDFEDSQRIFLTYSCGTVRANHLCIASAIFSHGDNGGEAALSDVEEIFRAQPSKTGSAHYGGRLAFLPDDTFVATVGDGFDYREEAQNPENHIGTTVRLNRDGSVPADNPFVGDPYAADEVYSYGHRNAQAVLHDPESDRIYSNEHGPKGGDEINIIEAGENYGWPVVTHGVDYTGAKITPFTEKEGMVDPIVDWTPSIAPSGMTMYHGELFPEWQGDLFSGALASRKVQRVMLEDGEVTGEESLFEDLDRRIRDVRTGPDGALYLLTDHSNGAVLRVVPAD